MSFKRFSSFFIFSVVGILFSVAVVNFIVDPLWMFKATQNIDIKQKDFNERVQKTNYLAFKDNNFDAVLLGNSRITYINQNDFDVGFKVFNYAVNAMPVTEYKKALDIFTKLTGSEPKIILIGVDLFNIGIDQKDIFQNAYNDTQKGINYRFKTLFTFDAFLFSLKNLVNNEEDRKQRFYNKFLEKGLKIENNINNRDYIKSSLGLKFKKAYSKKVLNHFKELKQKYKNSKFVVFTAPLHSDLLSSWEENEKFQLYYTHWLKDLVSLFGKVHHFMYDSSISKSYYTFFDAFHFYPFVGQKIAQKISNNDFINTNDDFGILLTNENIDMYLKNFTKDQNSAF